jgi:hypothetical protein
MQFETGDTVILFPYSGPGEHLLLDEYKNPLIVGKKYIVRSIGKYEFDHKNPDDAIAVFGGYGGYHPAEAFQLVKRADADYQIFN